MKEVGKIRNVWCPQCGRTTNQQLVASDPNDPDTLLLWQCGECGEETKSVD